MVEVHGLLDSEWLLHRSQPIVAVLLRAAKFLMNKTNEHFYSIHVFRELIFITIAVHGCC